MNKKFDIVTVMLKVDYRTYVPFVAVHTFYNGGQPGFSFSMLGHLLPSLALFAALPEYPAQQLKCNQVVIINLCKSHMTTNGHI